MSKDAKHKNWQITPPSIEVLEKDIEAAGVEFFNTSFIRQQINQLWGDEPNELDRAEDARWALRTSK